MIIINISGGLGNQMFEYAAARRLSAIHNTELKLDLTGFKKQKHKFYLDRFKTRLDFASKQEINSLVNISLLEMHPKIPSMLQPIYEKFLKIRYKSFIAEKYFHFDETFLNASNNAYLLGYWQSEKYFADIASIIRNEFKLRRALSKRSSEMLSGIINSQSISINVRRGDYVSDYSINKKHGVLDLSYYNRAISYLENKINKPHFYFFSDDMPWVKKNFRLDYPTTYMDFNYPEGIHEDLILTSSCRYNICANSTFSWWAAWLNNYREKIVIAPRRWFRDQSLITKDLLPQKWLRL